MADAYPAVPRALAGAGAAVVAYAFLLASPLGLMAGGYPLTAGLMVATALPLVAFLALVALAPAALQRLLAPISRLDLRDPGHVGAAIVMAGTLFFVLGMGSLVEGAYAWEDLRKAPAGEEADALDVTSTGLAVGLTFNLVILIVPALLYVALVHAPGQSSPLRELGLAPEGAMRSGAAGVGVALLFILGLGVLTALSQAAGFAIPENERALAIARSVTVAGALGIAVVSSLSEEIFFRGFLQPRVGLLAQAALFSLAHLNYVNALEIIVTFALGLVFGLMRQRSGNVWGPIAAHFTFNLVMLLAGIYGDQLAPAEPDGTT